MMNRAVHVGYRLSMPNVLGTQNDPYPQYFQSQMYEEVNIFIVHFRGEGPAGRLLYFDYI